MWWQIWNSLSQNKPLQLTATIGMKDYTTKCKILKLYYAPKWYTYKPEYFLENEIHYII